MGSKVVLAVSRYVARPQLVVRVAVVGVFSVAFGTGCARRHVFEPRAIIEESVGEPVEHIIRYPGENLGLVSAWYTGKASNWDKIADANPGLDRNRLRVGDLIIIPADMVVRFEELPPEKVEQMLAEGLKDFEADLGESPASSSAQEEVAGTNNSGAEKAVFPVGRPEPKIDLPSNATSESKSSTDAGSSGSGSNSAGDDNRGADQSGNQGTVSGNQKDEKGSTNSEPSSTSEGVESSSEPTKPAAKVEKRPTPLPSRFKTQEEMLRELLAE